VRQRRAEIQQVQSPLFPYWLADPGSEPVDAGGMLANIIERVRRHVVLPLDRALVIALWIMSTWVHETAAVHSSILVVTSPEAGCGKSTLLRVPQFLVARGLVCVETSAAALFRAIEKWMPRVFATFCPKAIGLKGLRLPDKTASRAIVVEMARKLPGETAQSFRYVDDLEFPSLIGALGRRQWRGVSNR
jgi:hypothetical protein